jgi:hypothetical protein
MKKNTIYALIVVALVVFGSFSKAFVLAEDKISIDGFGDSKLTSVVPSKVNKSKQECLSFEASFSKPLDKQPSAILDIERYFTNIWNSVLEVTKISNSKYRMTLKASTEQGCPEVEDESRLTISTYSGKEESNQKQTLPEAVTFKAVKKADQKDPVLKKE